MIALYILLEAKSLALYVLIVEPFFFLLGAAFSYDRKFLGSISHDQLLKVLAFPLSLSFSRVDRFFFFSVLPKLCSKLNLTFGTKISSDMPSLFPCLCPCSCGIWMIYCKVLEIPRLSQLLQTVMVTRWMWMMQWQNLPRVCKICFL